VRILSTQGRVVIVGIAIQFRYMILYPLKTPGPWPRHFSAFAIYDWSTFPRSHLIDPDSNAACSTEFPNFFRPRTKWHGWWITSNFYVVKYIHNIRADGSVFGGSVLRWNIFFVIFLMCVQRVFFILFFLLLNYNMYSRVVLLHNIDAYVILFFEAHVIFMCYILIGWVVFVSTPVQGLFLFVWNTCLYNITDFIYLFFEKITSPINLYYTYIIIPRINCIEMLDIIFILFII
jgi:hypothetical protein